MIQIDDTRAEASPPAKSDVARIWDLPTRLFHWALVLAVAICAKTGFFGPTNGLDWHIWSGYAIGALVVFRMVWSLFGSEFSRLDRLFRALTNLPEHALRLLQLRPKHYLGHNPAGSLMILGLVLVLLALVASGMVVLGGLEKQGALAGVTTFSLGQIAKELHEWLAYLLMAMIAGHLAGVLAETVLLRVPLVRGMITGWLPVPSDTPRRGWRPARPVLATIGTGFAALAVTALIYPLTRIPAYGLPAPVPAGSTYAKECGACHWSFHPSLLPRTSWATLMGKLDDHFGEDASMSQTAATEITAYLEANAAETADTEPANRFRKVAEADPIRITKTRFWTRTHDHIEAAVFASPAVKSRANCAACHRDALTGRFDDQAIDIPTSPPPGTNP
jgi:cytochrome b